jgi:hypothetical protein
VIVVCGMIATYEGLAALSGAFTFHTSVSVGSLPLAEVWVNGTLRSAVFTLDFGSVNPGSWLNVTLNIHNVGNAAGTSVVVATMGGAGWTVGYTQNNTAVLAGNWLNGTLYYWVPADATSQVYSGDVTVGWA